MPEINPSLFWTGLVLGLVAVATALLRNLPKTLFDYTRRAFIVRVDIMNNDNLFDWLKLWFDRDTHSKKSRLISASAMPLTEWNQSSTAPKKWRIIFTPSAGYHLLFYRGRPVLVNRDRRDVPGAGGAAVGLRETFILYFFTRNQNLVRDFLQDAQQVAEEDRKNKLTIFTADLYVNWNVLTHRDVRPFESVILDEGVKEAAHKDMQAFLSSETWYRNMAIPFHRGYLFYGPPGSGKTSCAIALASAFHMDIYLLNLNNLNDTRLNTLLTSIPPHSVLMLEDIDSAFDNREALGKVTFSGFLNALDGIHARDGIIVFMSTNHIEKLDPALMRPGRIDCKVYLGYATEYQIREMFLRFFPEYPNQAISFAASLQNKTLSMAAIQEYLLINRDSVEAALGNAETAFSEHEAKFALPAGN